MFFSCWLAGITATNVLTTSVAIWRHPSCHFTLKLNFIPNWISWALDLTLVYGKSSLQENFPSHFHMSSPWSRNKNHKLPHRGYPLSWRGPLARSSRDTSPYWWGMGHFLSTLLKPFESVCSLGQSWAVFPQTRHKLVEKQKNLNIVGIL